MKKFILFYETAKFPLKILFLASVFIFIGTITMHNYTQDLVSAGSIGESILALFSYLGVFLAKNFPLILLVAIVGRTFASYSFALFAGIIGYIVFNVSTMIFAPTDFPIDTYQSILGLQMHSLTSSGLEVIKMPINTGIFGAIIVGLLTNHTFMKNREKRLYGVLGFIENELYNLLAVIIKCIIAGVIISYAWIGVVWVVDGLVAFISNDITDPFRMFVYTISEKVFNIVGLDDLIRAPFLFTDSGGSILGANLEKISGDSLIWMNQISTQIFKEGIGRFGTTTYIVSIFAMPAFILAVYSQITSKAERKKYIIFTLFAMMISMISGNTIAIEIFMLLTSPILFLLHLVLIGLLSAGFLFSDVTLGIATNSQSFLAQGNLLDFIYYGGIPALKEPVIIITIVGIIVALIYFFVTKYYYHNASLRRNVSTSLPFAISDFIEAIGGRDNIEDIDSSLSRVTVQLVDCSKVNLEKIKQLGASGIVEKRNGYTFIFGAISKRIHSEIVDNQNNIN